MFLHQFDVYLSMNSLTLLIFTGFLGVAQVHSVRRDTSTKSVPAPVLELPDRTSDDDRRSLTVLRQAIQSKDPLTRIIAVQAASKITGLESWLAYALGDPEHDVRLAAVESLALRLSPRALRLLRSVREDTHEDLDIRALAAALLLQTRTPTEAP